MIYTVCKDQALQRNVRKAPKLTYKSLHPGNNKQNVNLALSIFDESTIAAFRSYFSERSGCSGFLSVVQKSLSLNRDSLLTNLVMRL